MTDIADIADSVPCLFPPNFRDLGGLSTVDGGRMRTGRLFRSCDLNAAEPAELESIARLRLRTAVDLRSGFERNLLGAADLGAVGAALVSVPMLDAAVFEALDRQAFSLAAVYDRITTAGHEDVCRAVAALAEPGALPAVIFCSAGKDRTGIVVAALLAALGVERRQILDDYEASAGTTHAVVERLMASMSPSDRPELPDGVFAAPRDALAEVLERIEDEFGDLRSYLLAGGLSSLSLVKLQVALVEPPYDELSA